MISEDKAKTIGQEWIESWNRHDLDAIMSHYAEEIEFISPFIIKLLGDASGTIKGKEALRSYFAKGLDTYPELKFELLQILTGVESLTIYYRSVKEMLAAEVMVLDSQDKIAKAIVHYSANSISKI
ncbi:nuclear transport factor 2 family protein [Aerosakkonema sp. BLCC-F183]|uniref:nuclear transport factor 2 family protein n=1 Tax=Aerosakkonema sp. BLCC-F183 TaxID=3342834 RepID=UPI0035B85A4A